MAGLGAGPLAAEPLVAGDFIFNGGFEASTFISTVQQDEVGYGGKSVIIDNVRVTAVKSTSGAYTLFLQDSMSSPQYSAIRVFVSGADAPTFNDLALTAIGDCVSITGTVGEFMGATELAPVTGFVRKASAACGPQVVPVAFADFSALASDLDVVTAGFQPGLMAEQYEGVLVQLQNVKVKSGNDGAGVFPVAAGDQSQPLMAIDKEFFLHTAIVGETFSSLTGVVEQRTNYYLEPRGAGDLVQ